MLKGLLPVRWLWELHWRVLNLSWGLKAKMNELCNYLKKEHSEQKWTANTKNVRSELAWWFSSVEKTLWWEVMSCISWLTYRIADEQGKAPRGLLGHHFQMQYKSFILVTFLSKMKKITAMNHWKEEGCILLTVSEGSVHHGREDGKANSSHQ